MTQLLVPMLACQQLSGSLAIALQVRGWRMQSHHPSCLQVLESRSYKFQLPGGFFTQALQPLPVQQNSMLLLCYLG